MAIEKCKVQNQKNSPWPIARVLFLILQFAIFNLQWPLAIGYCLRLPARANASKFVKPLWRN